MTTPSLSRPSSLSACSAPSSFATPPPPAAEPCSGRVSPPPIAGKPSQEPSACHDVDPCSGRVSPSAASHDKVDRFEAQTSPKPRSPEGRQENPRPSPRAYAPQASTPPQGAKPSLAAPNSPASPSRFISNEMLDKIDAVRNVAGASGALALDTVQLAKAYNILKQQLPAGSPFLRAVEMVLLNKNKTGVEALLKQVEAGTKGSNAASKILSGVSGALEVVILLTKGDYAKAMPAFAKAAMGVIGKGLSWANTLNAIQTLVKAIVPPENGLPFDTFFKVLHAIDPAEFAGAGADVLATLLVSVFQGVWDLSTLGARGMKDNIDGALQRWMKRTDIPMKAREAVAKFFAGAAKVAASSFIDYQRDVSKRVLKADSLIERQALNPSPRVIGKF